MSNLELFRKVSNILNKKNKYVLDKDILDKLALNNIVNFEGDNDSSGTKVSFYVNKFGLVYGFMMHGRSGYASDPYDIVSSSLSVLGYHTINTIRLYTNDLTEIKKEDALLMLILPNLKNGRSSDIAKIMLRAMVPMILDIQKQYSRYVKVVFKRDL